MMLVEIPRIRNRERLEFFEDMMAATSAQISLHEVRRYQNRLRGDRVRVATQADLESIGIQVIHG